MKIRNFAYLAFLALVAIGCSTNAPPSQDAAGNKAGSGAASSTAQQADSPPAKTPEELVENFKSALASRNTAAINKMVRWEGNEQGREFVMKLSLSVGSAGTAKVIEAKLKPVEAADQLPGAPLPFTHVLDYTIQDNDGKSKKSTRVKIAQIDQHYFFYFFVPQTNK